MLDGNVACKVALAWGQFGLGKACGLPRDLSQEQREPLGKGDKCQALKRPGRSRMEEALEADRADLGGLIQQQLPRAQPRADGDLDRGRGRGDGGRQQESSGALELGFQNLEVEETRMRRVRAAQDALQLSYTRLCRCWYQSPMQGPRQDLLLGTEDVQFGFECEFSNLKTSKEAEQASREGTPSKRPPSSSGFTKGTAGTCSGQAVTFCGTPSSRAGP